MCLICNSFNQSINMYFENSNHLSEELYYLVEILIHVHCGIILVIKMIAWKNSNIISPILFPETLKFDSSPLCVKWLLKLPPSEEAWSRWLQSFGFSQLCIFICLLKLSAREDAKLHWLHFFDFSPLCLLICVLNELGSEHAKSHWLHLLDFSPLCVFKCFLKWLACVDL